MKKPLSSDDCVLVGIFIASVSGVATFWFFGVDPGNVKIWAAATILIAVCALVILGRSNGRYRREKKLERFAGRVSLSDEEVYRQFYSTTGIRKEIVLREWHLASTILEVPSGLLRPTDRFDRMSSLAGWEWDDRGFELLLRVLSRRLGMPVKRIEPKMKTLDNYVLLAAGVTSLCDGV